MARSSGIGEQGEEVLWESIRRKRHGQSIIVIAKMVPSQRYILIKQFRQTLNGYVIGFPAGISYSDARHGLQELKEETGFIGQIIEESPVLKATIGLIDEDCQVITVDVDERHPQNQAPVQDLDSSEEIEVLVLPKDEIKTVLLREQENGTHIAAGVWYIFGLSV